MARFWRSSRHLLIPTSTGPPIHEPDEGLLLDRASRLDSPELVFLCGGVFTCASISTAGRLMREPAAGELFVFLLLFIGCLLLLTALVRTVRGGERLRLDAGGLDYRWSFGFARRRRLVPLGEVKSVSMYAKPVSHLGFAGAHSEYGLEIATLGQPLRVGQSRLSDDVAALKARFEKRIREFSRTPYRKRGKRLPAGRSRPTHPPAGPRL